MKKYCFLLPVLLFFAFAFYSEGSYQIPLDKPIWYSDFQSVALPVQAGVCDIIGVGHLHTQTTNGVVIKMDTLWYGSLTNDYIRLSCPERILFPSNNIPSVFFFIRYPYFYKLRKTPYSCLFDMSNFRNRFEPQEPILFNQYYSWFPATPENEHLVWWCSNLVHYSQIEPDRMKFYELLRDGYRLHKMRSRIHIDSFNTLARLHYFSTTNFVKEIAGDTNLVGAARDMINNFYMENTGEDFPPLNPFPKYTEPADDNHYLRME